MPSDDNKNHRLKRKRQKTRSRSIESHGKSRSKEQKSKSNHHRSSHKRRSPSTSRLKSPRKRDDRKRRSADRRSDYGDVRSSNNHDFRKDHYTRNTFKDRRRSISRHNDRRRRSHSSDHYDRFKELVIRGDKIIKNEKAASPKPFMVPSNNHKSNLTAFASGSFMHNDRNSFSSQFSFPSTAPEEIQKDQRKRKSRWTEGDTGRIYIPGLPTTLPPNLSPEQEKAYILQLQIEEISRRLRLPNLGIPENHLLRHTRKELLMKSGYCKDNNITNTNNEGSNIKSPTIHKSSEFSFDTTFKYTPVIRDMQKNIDTAFTRVQLSAVKGLRRPRICFKKSEHTCNVIKK
ncbi:hypothetical protein GJ496_009759 [Pomphorhynchus laevis]|nr:hypothetical protein GJ496_009759 [Pomphorhynchus laevis]